MSTRTTDKDRRRAQIVEAATTVFARDGYRPTRVADIAVAAGVGKGTVYEYFDSKEELFFAVFEALHTDVRNRILEIAEAPGGVLERIERLMRLGASVVATAREMHGVTLAFWSASIGSAVENRFESACVEQYKAYRELLAGLIREGVASGELRHDVDPEAAATMLVAALDGLVVQHWFEPGIDPETVVDRFMAVLNGGLTGGLR